MHHKASVLFEDILFETDYYIEEFLIHLERGNSYKKAHFYTLKYAKVQDLLGNLSKSIFYWCRFSAQLAIKKTRTPRPQRVRNCPRIQTRHSEKRGC